jgi:hypothetical protein
MKMGFDREKWLGSGPVLGGPLCDILVLDVRSVDLYQDVH